MLLGANTKVDAVEVRHPYWYPLETGLLYLETALDPDDNGYFFRVWDKGFEFANRSLVSDILDRLPWTEGRTDYGEKREVIHIGEIDPDWKLSANGSYPRTVHSVLKDLLTPDHLTEPWRLKHVTVRKSLHDFYEESFAFFRSIRLVSGHNYDITIDTCVPSCMYDILTILEESIELEQTRFLREMKKHFVSNTIYLTDYNRLYFV